MHEQVKKYADEGNIKGLKYIFVDALDVDPTFEKYREDFHYCKGLNLFEPNRELSPKKQNSSIAAFGVTISSSTETLSPVRIFFI